MKNSNKNTRKQNKITWYVLTGPNIPYCIGYLHFLPLVGWFYHQHCILLCYCSVKNKENTWHLWDISLSNRTPWAIFHKAWLTNMGEGVEFQRFIPGKYWLKVLVGPTLKYVIDCLQQYSGVTRKFGALGQGTVWDLCSQWGTQLSFWYECAAQRAENRGLRNGLLPNLGS